MTNSHCNSCLQLSLVSFKPSSFFQTTWCINITFLISRIQNKISIASFQSCPIGQLKEDWKFSKKLVLNALKTSSKETTLWRHRSLSLPQLSNLWWIPNSVSKGFDTAMKRGSSRRFKRYVSVKLTTPYCGLRLILVYPNPQYRKADLTLTYRLWGIVWIVLMSPFS